MTMSNRVEIAAVQWCLPIVQKILRIAPCCFRFIPYMCANFHLLSASLCDIIKKIGKYSNDAISLQLYDFRNYRKYQWLNQYDVLQ